MGRPFYRKMRVNLQDDSDSIAGVQAVVIWPAIKGFGPFRLFPVAGCAATVFTRMVRARRQPAVRAHLVIGNDHARTLFAMFILLAWSVGDYWVGPCR